MVHQKPPTHFCLVVGDYVLEEIGGKAYLSSVSGQYTTYEFSNGLGTLLTDSLTLEVFDAVLAHLRRFNRTTFQTSFQQAVFAATMKEPTPEMEYGKRLKQAFAVAATGLMVIPVIQLVHSFDILSSAPKSVVVAASADKSDEETDEKKEDDETGEGEEEGESYCSKNAEEPKCKPGEDGDVG